MIEKVELTMTRKEFAKTEWQGANARSKTLALFTAQFTREEALRALPDVISRDIATFTDAGVFALAVVYFAATEEFKAEFRGLHEDFSLEDLLDPHVETTNARAEFWLGSLKKAETL